MCCLSGSGLPDVVPVSHVRTQITCANLLAIKLSRVDGPLHNHPIGDEVLRKDTSKHVSWTVDRLHAPHKSDGNSGEYHDNSSISGSELSETARLPDDESDDGGPEGAENGSLNDDQEVTIHVI